jgi:hypothetical protein
MSTANTNQSQSKAGLFAFVGLGLCAMTGVMFGAFYAEDTIMPWYLGKERGRTVQSTPVPIIADPKPKRLPEVPATMALPADEPALRVRSGLALWLRADATPNTVQSGDLVMASPDASGNNNHAKQPFPLNRPRLAGNAVNGKPALRFDGVDDFYYFGDGLAKNSKSGDGFSPATVFAVWGRPAYCENRQTPDGGNFQRLYSSGALGADYLKGGMYAIVNAADDKNSLVMLEPNKFYAPLTPSKIHKAVFATPVDLRNFVIGRLNISMEQPFTGEIAEMLVFTRVLSAEEQAQVEQYLKTKYSL